MGRGIRYTSVGDSRRVATEQIKLILTLAVTGCVLIALETTALSRIRIPLFGWQAAAPSLGLLFSMAVGFLHGEREGGVTGLICGWLSDATMGDGMMLFPLLYFLCGYLSGTVGKRRLAHNLPSFMVFSLIGGGIHCLFGYLSAALNCLLFGGSFPSLSWVWQGLIPVWILTVLVSPIPYLLVWGEKKLLHIDQ